MEKAKGGGEEVSEREPFSSMEAEGDTAISLTTSVATGQSGRGETHRRQIIWEGDADEKKRQGPECVDGKARVEVLLTKSESRKKPLL